MSGPGSEATPAPAYLENLTLTLALGAAEIPRQLRDDLASWLHRQQRPDGGFAGREGDSDPYYTAFGLRGLLVLGRLDEAVAAAAAHFLRGQLSTQQSVVDLVSLVFGAAMLELAAGQTVIPDDGPWRQRLAETLETLRTEDGGYAKTPEGRAGSSYQSFLTVLCLQLAGLPIPHPDRLGDFLLGQAHPDGGFLEIRAAKRAGVNPTAAAIGTLRCIDQLDRIDRQKTARFIASGQSDEGGLTANTRIPFADLLSTFTGMWTLADLQRDAPDLSDEFDIQKARRYALSMQNPEGGFNGFALDSTADVEYTFYGIGTLALCPWGPHL
ncbi:MAG: prenyltransferase/squalene oxidase repeat-containing protein [Planctomycetota bacterium]